MPVNKIRDMDWEYYLNEIVASGGKMSTIEKQEFAGFLLKKDTSGAELSDYLTVRSMWIFNQYAIMEKICAWLTNECEETKDELLGVLKATILEQYEYRINKLIELKIATDKLPVYNEDDGA